MTALVECIACQHGAHDEHVASVPPPPGALGGFECPCKGGCRDRPRESHVLGQALSQALSPSEAA
jgi:hypothetical protein